MATLDAAGMLDLRNGLAAAEASLGEAQATATAAELNLRRVTDLVKYGAVSQAEVEPETLADSPMKERIGAIPQDERTAAAAMGCSVRFAG
jgi:multidrug resistance efflux pump